MVILLDKIIIKKPTKLKGTVKISGSKNAAIPILCTSLLSRGKVVLKNVPKITDILKLCRILKRIHCRIKWFMNTLTIDSSEISYEPLVFKECMQIRGSYYLIPVFLYLFGKCEIALPGGCKIGRRPIDIHLEAFKAFGYNSYTVDNILSVIKNDSQNKEVQYTMSKQSVGASINAILTSLHCSYATIDNLVLEPEALAVVELLNQMGYDVVALRSKCVYKGYKGPQSQKIKYRIIPDRMEAMTFIVMGLLCGKIKVKGINIHHMKYPLDLLIRAKYKLRFGKKYIIAYESRGNSFDIQTEVYPLFPTDLQPIFGVLLAHSRGTCTVEEKIFENRMQIYHDMISSGAGINVIDNKAYIIGGTVLSVNTYTCSDLRQAAAVLILVLKHGGTVENIELIQRGYEALFFKLRMLGARFALK